MKKKGGIFVSYRRDDSSDVTGRIHDGLIAAFGMSNVFMDVDSIAPGDEFVNTIGGWLDRTSVLLVVIGPDWATACDAVGRRRLHDPADFVRIEIERSLQRGIRVVPVLVKDAQFPKAADLPDSMKGLLGRQAFKVRKNPDYRHDMDSLIKALSNDVPPAQSASSARRVGVIAGASIVAIAGLGAAFMWPKPEPAATPVDTAAIETSTTPAIATSPPVEVAAAPAAEPASAPPAADPQSAPPPLQQAPPATAPKTTTQAPAPQVAAPAPAQSKPRISASVANAFVSATRRYDTSSMASLKLQLSVTNNSDRDVAVLLYTYRDKQMTFAFAGGGSVRPNMYSTMSIDTCSDSRPVRCRTGNTYMDIAAGQSITVPIEIRGSIAAPFDQRSKLASGTLSFTLLVNAGGDEDANILLNVPATVDSSSF